MSIDQKWMASPHRNLGKNIPNESVISKLWLWIWRKTLEIDVRVRECHNLWIFIV